MPAILEIRNLGKRYKDFTLSDVSFTLEPGYIMGFIGPNGAGKSTTIRLIMNLIRRDEGEIRIFGQDNIRQEQAVKERIGFVYDEDMYYGELTTLQMKGVIAPFYARWDNARFEKLMKEFSLPADRRIKDLSKGMKLKFSLAVALSHNADLFLMDEPTSGLDPVVRSEILEILTREIQDENKAVFFSTHITSDLDKIADYVTLLHEGKVVFSRTKDEITEDFALVKGAAELLDADTRKAFVGIRTNRFGFEGLAHDRRHVRQLFGDSVVMERPTLEDVMLYHTRRDDRDGTFDR